MVDDVVLHQGLPHAFGIPVPVAIDNRDATVVIELTDE